MALDTYDGLVATIADFLNRTDLTLAIPSFVTLAEAQMNRRLACREMWGITTVNIACERAPLPSDFQAIESISDQCGKLTYVSPQLMDDEDHFYWYGSEVFRPRRKYTIAGREFVFPHVFCPAGSPPVAPTPPQPCVAHVRYRKRLCALGTSNESNWCLEKNPDAYLYTALKHSAPYLKDDERIEVWGALSEQALADIADMDARVIADTLEVQSDVAPGAGYGRDRRYYGYP